MQHEHRPLWVRTLRGVARFLVTAAVVFYTVLDDLLFPLFRPLIRWLGSLRLFQRLGEWIGRLPPYAVLVLLGVPFVIIEPAKVLALWWGATGHIVTGALLLLVAQILSLLICERIFHAGYEPLMRIEWLRRLLGWVFGLRDRAIAWARATTVWQESARLVRSAREWIREVIVSLRSPPS